MKITILAVGKIKEHFYRQAVEEFEKRLSRYCKLEIIEVADEKTPDHASRAQEIQILEREGARLSKYLREDAWVGIRGNVKTPGTTRRWRREPYPVCHRRIPGAM